MFGQENSQMVHVLFTVQGCVSQRSYNPDVAIRNSHIQKILISLFDNSTRNDATYVILYFAVIQILCYFVTRSERLQWKTEETIKQTSF